MLTYGSVCSGIEAASVAWHPLGWRPTWFAEIEPFPSAVLAHRFPDVPNLGDMTAIADRIERGEVEAPDALVGGTPCQAFSVAGKRGSLDDERGNLSLAFCRLADAIDRRRRTLGLRPCIILWENVPGVLSTKDNAFGCILAGLAGEDAALVAPGGRWTDAGCVRGPVRNAAWRILDAQWFGVAQRRERVFVVASAGAIDPGAVLLEWEGVRRDSPPSREAREGASADAGGRAAFGGGRQSGSLEVGTALTTKQQRLDWESETLVVHSLRGEGFDASEDGTGRWTPIVPVGSHWDNPSNAHPTLNQSSSASGGIGASNQEVFAQRGGGIVPIQNATRGKSQNGLGVADAGSPMFTLDQASQHAVAFQQNTRDEVRLMNGDGQIAGALASEAGMKQQNYIAVPYDLFQITAPLNRQSRKDGDPCHTLARDNAAHAAVVTDAVAFQACGDRDDPGLSVSKDCAFTIPANPMSDRGQAVAVSMQVRRLTPRECERLQGFPDDWTLIPYRGKPAADGPRYKAIGNSMAVPVISWLGRRIEAEVRKCGNPT